MPCELRSLPGILFRRLGPAIRAAHVERAPQHPAGMKILLVTNYQPPHMGGIEFAAVSLMRCWRERGHEVVWLTADLPPGGAPSTPDNVRLPAFNQLESMLQINSPILPPWRRAAVRRLVRECDVVNVHSLAPGISNVALCEAVRARKPLVVTQHVGVIPLRWEILSTLQRHYVIAMARKALRAGAWLTFVGAAVREWFIENGRLDTERIAMTPAGIDQSTYYFVPDEERQALRQRWKLSSRLNVLFVGRFYDKKGLPLIRGLAQRCPDFHFTLVGSGPIRPSEWQLPNVERVGFVSNEDLRGLYGAHDVFIMPSFGEGWPAVVPQAMACGLGCLISEECFSGFNRDPNRFVVRARDVLKMSEALREIANGSIPAVSNREETSRYARRTWDWQATADIYLDLFNQAIREALAK